MKYLLCVCVKTCVLIHPILCIYVHIYIYIYIYIYITHICPLRGRSLCVCTVCIYHRDCPLAMSPTNQTFKGSGFRASDADFGGGGNIMSKPLDNTKQTTHLKRNEVAKHPDFAKDSY